MYHREYETLKKIDDHRNVASLQGTNIIGSNASMYFPIMHFLWTKNISSIPTKNCLIVLNHRNFASLQGAIIIIILFNASMYFCIMLPYHQCINALSPKC